VLLPLLLAVGAAAPAQRPQNDLSLYLAIAAEYRAGRRETALREIRQWRRDEITAGLAALGERADRWQAVALWQALKLKTQDLPPVGIDFLAVEAAALLHVEAGLLELQSLGVARAERHFVAARDLVDWSHAFQARHLLVQARLRELSTAPTKPDVPIELRIDEREFDIAVAAATLALGFPEAALPFAERARRAAPRDAEALLWSGCVKESLALQEKVRAREAEARRLREEAEALFREALAADPAQAEARLRLGSVLLAEGRPQDAEPVLRQAAEEARDKPQLYLALLFLGRASEMQDKPSDGATFYRRALEAWPESQAARLGLARDLESSAGPPAARALVAASLADSRKETREPDPWWSYPFGPRGLAKTAMERLWQRALGRSFGS